MTYDPAALSLTFWYRAPYSGSPLLAVASAGSSGSNGNMTEATNPPSVGASAGGKASADFDGTNDRLSNANELDTFFSTSAWSVSGVVAADTVSARSVGAAYSDDSILGQDVNGLWYLTFTADGITAGHFTGAVFAEVTKACAADGQPHTFHAWYDGTNLNLTVDGSSATPVAAANAFGYSGFGVLVAGKNYDGSAFFDGRLWDILGSNTNLGSTARTNIESYFRGTYYFSLINGAGTIALSQSGSAKGAGTCVGAGTVAITGSGSAKGAGTCAGAGAFTLTGAATGALTGISAAASFALSQSGTLDGTVNCVGTSAIALTASASGIFNVFLNIHRDSSEVAPHISARSVLAPLATDASVISPGARHAATIRGHQ